MHNPTPLSLRRLEQEHRYLDLLVRAGEILSNALNWEQTVNAVCDAVVETVADLCILYVKDDEGKLAQVAAAHRDPEFVPTVHAASTYIHERKRPAMHVVVRAVMTGESICVPEVDDEFLRANSVSTEHEQYMRRLKYRSLMVVPLVTTTQGIIGALKFVRTDRSTERFDGDSLRFAKDLARRCATAIAKARLYEQTLHIARVYQRAALPDRLPVHERIAFDAFYEPSSEELLVGGDWYDAFELVDGRIAVTVGDVLGHGIEAAIWMGRLRNGLRAALFSKPDPVEALEVADHMLCVEHREEFATALVALIDPVRQTLSCASAGHPGPLMWDEAGDVMDPFVERGLPLGLRRLGPVQKTSEIMRLATGTFAVFFTDGLIEWNRNIADAWSSLQDAISRPAIRDALHPATAIRHAVITGERHRDDIAILTVQLKARNGN